ncbi:MAG TPA: MBL fold metallo-hydrolase [Thermodesulfobacteriota bacterium]|nr:MBL fold metallo-hydrolase [Thermodesulfobacteriota bacterium]
MRIREPGKVREGIWYFGREESGVYLLEGNRSTMMISGGMSYIVPDVLQQLKEFGRDENRIKKLLILHSHFDHVGIVPFFKRRLPAMEVYASPRAWEVVQMDKAVMTINEFGRSVARRMEKEEVYSTYDLEWRKDVSGNTVRDGDRIDLGGLEVVILEIPGHSSCCIAAYVPEFKALFPTDGGGIPFRETIVSSGNSNYTKYQQSLERLKALEVDYLCADHYGYVLGPEANAFISKSIEMAKKDRAAMEAVYRSTRDIDAAARRLRTSFYEQNPHYFLSPEIFLDVYRQMVRHLAAAMGGEG